MPLESFLEDLGRYKSKLISLNAQVYKTDSTIFHQYVIGVLAEKVGQGLQDESLQIKVNVPHSYIVADQNSLGLDSNLRNDQLN